MENKTVKQIWICVQHDFFISRKYGWLCREGGGGGTSTVTFAWQLQKKEISFKPVTWLKFEEGVGFTVLTKSIHIKKQSSISQVELLPANSAINFPLQAAQR